MLCISLLPERIADLAFVNPSPDHDVGSARALGDNRFIIVVEFIVTATDDMLCIHLVEAAAVCLQADRLRKIGVAGCEQGVMDRFGILGIEDDRGEGLFGGHGHGVRIMNHGWMITDGADLASFAEEGVDRKMIVSSGDENDRCGRVGGEVRGFHLLGAELCHLEVDGHESFRSLDEVVGLCIDDDDAIVRPEPTEIR